MEGSGKAIFRSAKSLNHAPTLFIVYTYLFKTFLYMHAGSSGSLPIRVFFNLSL